MRLKEELREGKADKLVMVAEIHLWADKLILLSAKPISSCTFTYTKGSAHTFILKTPSY